MADLAKRSGSVFDAIFQHGDNPPPTPVAANSDAFVEWTKAHLIQALNLYTAYPTVTAKEVKALASAADVSRAGELHPFLVILPIKSYLHFILVKLVLRARGREPRKTWIKSARRTSPSSFHSKTIKSVFSPFMTVHSISTSPISLRTSARYSISSSNSPKTRRRHHAESTFRNSLTLQKEPTALRSGSIGPIPDCRSRTSMP